MRVCGRLEAAVDVCPRTAKRLQQTCRRGEERRVEQDDDRRCRRQARDERLTIARGNRTFSFTIDDVSRNQLLNGWDDIDLTGSYRARIADFKTADRERRPWARPAQP